MRPHAPLPLFIAVLVSSCRPPSPPLDAPDSAGDGESVNGRLTVASSWGPAPPRLLDEPDAILYEIRFQGRAHQRFEVRALFPTHGRDALSIAMPVWIPGSYLIREFSRNVIAPRARARDGRSLPLEKTRKNRFRAESRGSDVIALEYEVYAPDLSVRESFVGPDLALINPASCLFYDVDRPEAPVRIAVHLPAEMSSAVAALDRVAGVAPPPRREAASASSSVAAGPPGAAEPSSGVGQVRPSFTADEPARVVGFRAESFDALADAPILVGSPRVDAFSVRGVEHALVHVGDLRRFPFERAARDVDAIVRAHATFWGGLPYERFLFLNVLDEGRGGLEHRASTLIMTAPSTLLTLEGYRRWLSLVSHELFHAWNGKRLRPKPLGPFDLEREAYTESLWFVEGLTSYYDDLLLRRAGVYDDESYLRALSATAKRLAETPGETAQSLATSSFDAWIEFYRPDADSPNQAVSYYTKGALVGFVLDAAIRKQSAERGATYVAPEEPGRAESLDDVLKAAYHRFSGEVGFEDQEIYLLLEEEAGAEIRALAESLVRRPGRLDLKPALETFGLRLASSQAVEPKDDFLAAVERRRQSELGLETLRAEGRVQARTVVKDGPAWRAGLVPGDELVALDGDRVPPEGLDALLALHEPGARIELLVARRGRMKRLSVVVGEKPPPLTIELDPSADHDARRRRALWLFGAKPEGR